MQKPFSEFWNVILENVAKVVSAICFVDIAVNGDLHSYSLHYGLPGKLFIPSDTLNNLTDDFSL